MPKRMVGSAAISPPAPSVLSGAALGALIVPLTSSGTGSRSAG
jgi:hypothetical protein